MTRTINWADSYVAQVTIKLNSAAITPQQPQTQTSKLNIQKTKYIYISVTFNRKNNFPYKKPSMLANIFIFTNKTQSRG